MQVNVKLSAFEGPLELLYHLIEKNEIDIYDIPIAALTDQYMAYIEDFPRDMDSMSSFIVMAASLLEIKSKMLLPSKKEELTPDEETDPREELVKKLLEYKRFKDISDFFKVRENSFGNVLFKDPDQDVLQLFKAPKAEVQDVLEGITLDRLYSVFQDVLKRKDLKTDKIRSSFNAVSKEIFTVEGKMDYLKNLLSGDKPVVFGEIFHDQAMKIEKIVTFLALLEMIKLKYIRIQQTHTFSDIIISLYEDKG